MSAHMRKVNLLVLTALAFLTVSCSAPRQQMDELHPGEPIRGYMAHRGVHLSSTLCGENSLEAISFAKRAGFFCIETDCRYTKDSVLVIIHDAYLNRTFLNADHSPIVDTVKVADLTLEQFQTQYVLKADRKEYQTAAPTLRQYLEKCREIGFRVFIEPKLNDPSGRFYEDIIRTADDVLGRQGYVITSNNFANQVIRNILHIDDVRLMGLLFKSSFEQMDSLCNMIYAVSSTAFSHQQYYENLNRAVSDGRVVQSAEVLRSHSSQRRFETFMRLRQAPKINYIATDYAAPDYHGQGSVLLHASDMKTLKNWLKTAEKVDFGGIYIDLKYSGDCQITCSSDTFKAKGDSSILNTLSYQRMFFDEKPNVAVVADSPDFAIKSIDVKIIKF